MKTVRLIFSDEMARAVVSGRKTVTRLPVMPQPEGMHVSDEGNVRVRLLDWRGRWMFDSYVAKHFASTGDLLIGRECWAPNDGHEPLYRATDGEVGWRPLSGWRPSIHMPDRAARIRRRVVSVTVERLQDISEADAVREGVERDERGWLNPRRNRANSTATVHSARQAFRLMWDDVYGSRGLGWDVNPWVWPIEFEGVNHG
jgi:hypothetical protein